MTPASHYELSLGQADNHFDLERRVNAGDSGDLYSAVSAGAFGAASSPSSARWDGTASDLDIESVSAAGSSITITTEGSTAMTSIVGT